MTSVHEDSLIACHECDLLFRKQPLRYGERANCWRCGGFLYQNKKDSLDRTLTLTLASLILFVLANVYPFMTFKLHGRVQESLLITGVFELNDQGLWPLAVLVFVVSIAFPLARILGMLYVLFPLKFNRRPWKGAVTFRFIETVVPWAMMEVYMLGVLVAYVKLIDLATIVLGIALYSFTGLIILTAAAGATLDPEVVWEKLEVRK